MPFHSNPTLKNRSLLATLILAAGLSVTAFAPSAVAAPLPTFSGWGVRDDSSFMGSVSQLPDGTLTGHFTIIIQKAGEDPTYCRYMRFRPNIVNGPNWNFDGYGTCWNSSGSFAAANRFAMSDYGSPGVGIDYIDVNYYGAVGVSIPGGWFDDGDFIYTP